MTRIVPTWRPPPSWTRRHAVAGVVSGLAGGMAYAVAMAVDRRAFAYDADDLLLLGGVATRSPERARRIGAGMHLVNSAALGILFERLAWRQLPFGSAGNGIAFASAENAVLYPLLLAEQRHPLISGGALPSYWNRTAFAQSVIRHIAYGLAAGWVLDRAFNDAR